MTHEEAFEVLSLIDTLRQHEGDSVTILCDNPEFHGPNNIIVCNGEWTDWKDVRFSGKSVLECLQKAAIERRHNDT